MTGNEENTSYWKHLFERKKELQDYPHEAIGGAAGEEGICERSKAIGVLHTCSIISWAESMGIAKETPVENSAFMQEMPTTSPARLIRGPPELPVLMAASVCIYCIALSDIPSSTACRDKSPLSRRARQCVR